MAGLNLILFELIGFIVQEVCLIVSTHVCISSLQLILNSSLNIDCMSEYSTIKKKNMP